MLYFNNNVYIINLIPTYCGIIEKYKKIKDKKDHP